MSEAWFGVQYALFEYMDPIKIGMDYVSLVGKLHVQKWLTMETRVNDKGKNFLALITKSIPFRRSDCNV